VTPTVSNLIRANVHRYNAKKIEQACQSELGLAYAAGDTLDVEALRGKIAICRQIIEESIDYTKISLADLMEELADE
jgi:hypothetical protein